MEPIFNAQLLNPAIWFLRGNLPVFIAIITMHTLLSSSLLLALLCALRPSTLLITAQAQAQRLGKPGHGSALTGPRFPEDLYSHPQYRVKFDGAPIRNASALEILREQIERDGAVREEEEEVPRTPARGQAGKEVSGARPAEVSTKQGESL